jgi:hypothetical protein
MPRIYISYRRTDSQAIIGRIYDRLVSHYGDGSVFIDNRSFPAGMDPERYSKEAVVRSDIIIAVIGRNWTGEGRIFDRRDPVRIEVETALQSGIPVLPVLVDGAAMPQPSDFPRELHRLTYFNVAAVDEGRDFHFHVDNLIHTMDRILDVPSAMAARMNAAAPSAMAAEPAAYQRPNEQAAKTVAGRAKTAAKIATAAAAGAAGVAIVAAAPAVAATVAVGALAVGGGAALVAGSVAAVKGLSRVAKRRRERLSTAAAAPEHPERNRRQESETEDGTARAAREARFALAKEEPVFAGTDARDERGVTDAYRSMRSAEPKIDAASPSVASKAVPEDDVECSVFAPARPRRGRTILIQALLHRAEQLAIAVGMASELDAGANRKGVAKLTKKIKSGTPIQFFLEIPALAIERPSQEITWSREPVRVVYAVHVPVTAPLGPCKGTLHMIMLGVPVGEVIFELNIEEQKISPAPGPQRVMTAIGQIDSGFEDDRRLDPVAVESVQFKKAFVSYSRKDARDALLYAEALEECGIKILCDLTEIEPSDEWEKKIFVLINDADVFYLMWSNNAMQSKWVDKESRAAVERYDREPSRVPRIRPVVIEQPAPEPPSHLARFHFNSKWLALRTAQASALFSSSVARPD